MKFRFGISGIWQHPQTTIPSVLAGLGAIAVALGWCSAETWEKYATAIGGILVMIIGGTYKGETP